MVQAIGQLCEDFSLKQFRFPSWTAGPQGHLRCWAYEVFPSLIVSLHFLCYCSSLVIFPLMSIHGNKSCLKICGCFHISLEMNTVWIPNPSATSRRAESKVYLLVAKPLYMLSSWIYAVKKSFSWLLLIAEVIRIHSIPPPSTQLFQLHPQSQPLMILLSLVFIYIKVTSYAYLNHI